ncbi:hypothetical protein [Polynucleobacter sp. AP-Nino-20-G2]|uniref:hypothetical protein n=1 Tax=Polynucleobacter sp. AP-Nino-20-G2 TaxID=2576917 RepID=UPI001BFE672F|nr:hypothetical protein [Polynucleobacter sp. AP-Nino-20-G2]QWE16280.1 hypothetical protein FD960_08340 [Polynucleobacter sp. AP-Nino-20-G2]
MPKSLEDYQLEFDHLDQYLSDSLDNGIITGDHYDNAGMIISALYPDETRSINMKNGNLDEGSDPDDIGGIPMLDMLFKAVDDKKQFVSDFREAIKECRNYNIDEVVAEIIKSR